MPEHGRVLEDGPLLRGETVHPCCYEGVERLGDGEVCQIADRSIDVAFALEAPVVEQHPDGLDRVEGDPVRALEDGRHGRIRETRHKSSEHLLHLGILERPQADRGERALAGPPVRASVEKLRSGEGDDVDGPPTRPRQHLLDEVDQAVVRPLEILEDEDDGSLFCDPLEEHPPCREQFVAVAPWTFLDAEQLEEGSLDHGSLVGRLDELVEALGQAQPGRGLIVVLPDMEPHPDHLAERPERDPVAIAGRPTLVPVDVFTQPVDVLQELPGEARLADPRLPEHGDKPDPALM